MTDGTDLGGRRRPVPTPTARRGVDATAPIAPASPPAPTAPVLGGAEAPYDRRRAPTAAGPVSRAAARAAAAHERRRRRRARVGILVVLGLVVLPFLLGAAWFWRQLDPPGSPGARVAVEVRTGWGVSEIGDALARRDVIGSALAFRVWAGATGAGPFAAGRYTLRHDLGVRAAIDALEAGPVRPRDARLLAPPGLTLRQIAERVGRLPGRSAERFLEVATSGAVRSRYQPPEVTSLDGLLYPDTYFVGPNDDEVAIARKMVARFDEIADQVGLADAPASAGLTPYQAVVAASLVQTEAGVPEDAALISAVIRNRLRDGVPLQIDSTLCFVKGGCPPSPTDADKAIDSPYNTYRVTGLPPTPISSVTGPSLTAALHPADVPYRYYVLIDASGRHKFAVTEAEHDRNVAEARRKGLL